MKAFMKALNSTYLITIAEVSKSTISVVSSVVSHLHELHKEISDEAAQTNANYKLRAAVRNILKTPNVGDVKKLHACSADLFQILNKLNDNVYVIDFGIISSLNVKDLLDYKGLDFVLLVDERLLLSLFLRVFSFLNSNTFYLIQQIKSIKS